MEQLEFLASYDPTNLEPLPATSETATPVSFTNSSILSVAGTLASLPNLFFAEHYQRSFAV